MALDRPIKIALLIFLVSLLHSPSALSHTPKGWKYVSNYPVEDFGISATPFDRSLYVLGGSYNDEYARDTPLFDRVWILDGDTLEWSWRTASGDMPIRRRFSCSALINGQIYVFGGKIATSHSAIDTMYSLKLKTFAWTQVIPRSFKNPPINIYMNCYSYQDKLFMYGGYADYTESTDLWTFDTKTRMWQLLTPSNEDILNYPPFFNSYGAIFQDMLFLYGGYAKYYSPVDVYYDDTPTLWRYNITKMRWEDPIEINGVFHAPFGTTSLYKNQMFIFGGILDPFWRNQSNSISAINLETFELEVIQPESWGSVAEYPIVSPSPRASSVSFFHEDRLIVYGGGYTHMQNDFWAFDTKRKKWVDSSLHKYPLGRANPHIARISDTKIAVFGGDLCQTLVQPINDLWLLNTDTFKWERIVQESECHPTNSSCAPPVQDAAFGYWNGYLYLIGGFLKGYDGPILKQYSIDKKDWSNIASIGSNEWFRVGTRYNSTFMGIGNQMYIWGGKYTNGTLANSDLLVFRMSENVVVAHNNVTNAPPVRITTKGMTIKDNFCFYDEVFKSSPNQKSEIWCFFKGKNMWEKVTTMSLDISDHSFISYNTYIVAFGISGQVNSKVVWLGNVETSLWSNTPMGNQLAPTRTQANHFLQSTKMFLFGGVLGKGNLGRAHTSGLYLADITEPFCERFQTISSEDQIVTDGSGKYLYFPDTNCTWSIMKTNFLIVEYVNLTDSANLTLFQNEECAGGFLLNRNQRRDKIHLNSLIAGDVIEVVSGDVNLSFQVEKDVVTSEGFSVRLFDCNLGFTARLSGCTCESGKYITFRGDCVPCPENSYQPSENESKCIPKAIESSEEFVRDLDSIKQTESAELSYGLPPMIYANAILIKSTIYVFGGSLSSDIGKTQLYHQMDVVHAANSAVNSVWMKLHVEGEVPSRRVLSCMISMGSYGVLIGGKAVNSDNFIYLFDPASRKWTRKSALPKTLIGIQCTEQNGMIHIYGGHDEYGTVSKKVYTYDPGLDTWKETSHSTSTLSRSHGSLLLRNDSIILYGGEYANEEPEGLVFYNKDFKQTALSDIRLLNCTFCDEEGENCFYGRKHFSFSVVENELHVFGGMRKGEVLEDIIIIDLDTSQVIYRKNYGHSLPDLPLPFPPPKFGSAFVSHGSKMVVIGGATSTDNVVNDVWVWDTEIRTWVDTSVLREPISRKEAGFGIIDENSFVVFGGSMQYFDEVLLNDLWTFNIDTRTWNPLFIGSLEFGPSPRAGAIVSVKSFKIFVSGGRTDVGVFDHQIWAFDLSTKTWEVENVANQLSSFQRPLNRFGIRAVQIGDTMWMWGGQISPGTRKAEFYSSVIGFDNKKGEIFSKNIIGNTPARRTYHSLCSVDSTSFSLYGGFDANGNTMNDHWIYNITSQMWAKADYISSNGNPPLSGHTCSSFDGFTVLNGMDPNGDGLYWMQQHEFRTQSKMFVSNRIFGYDAITYQSSGAMKGMVVSFGGKNEHLMTNKVVAYRPGFCSQTPRYIESEFTSSVFHDGSGAGMYLEGTNCTWILPNATHLIIQKQIRDRDNIEIRALSGENIEQFSDVISSRSLGKTEKIFTSKSGFIVRFTSLATSNTTKDKPCLGCEGFNITHARCPPNSYLDANKHQCVCESEYTLRNDICTKETITNYYAIVGGSVGGLLFMISTGIYVYRKRLIDGIKGSEKKLYGFIDPKELIQRDLLGSGSFGDVYMGEWRGADVAIKVLKNKNLSDEQITAFKGEISVMVELRHPNILLYMGACLDRESMCLVCEYMHQGSLYNVLHSDKQIPLFKRLQFLSDISKGMHYLHSSSPPILHRDLKSLNILVDDRDKLKVSDFGLTTIQGAHRTDGNIGSLLWLAPEIIGGGEYTTHADVYSFGIITWEIMSRRDPYFDHENTFVIAAQVVTNQIRPTMPENVPEDIQTMIRSLWAQNASERPTFQQASKKISDLVEASRHSSSSSFINIIDEEETPPQGSICIVCSHIYGSDTLWDDMPEWMADAVLMQMKILKDVSRKYRGYVSQNDGENMIVVFQEILPAIRYAAESQVKLNEAEWNPELLKHECCSSVADGQLKGLRVKMGISYGICTSSFDEMSRRTVYTGKCVTSARKTCRNSHGGQILVQQSVFEGMEEKRGLLEKELIIDQIQSDESSTKNLIHKICPKGLPKRAELHHQLQLSYVMSIESNPCTKSSYDGMLNIPIEFSHLENAPKVENRTDKENLHGYDERNHATELLPSSTEKEKKESKPWELNIKDISVDKTPIGSGSYGSVYPGEYKGKKVAIKKINGGGNQSDSTLILFFSEVSILRKLRHPNIVEFVGASTNALNLAIVMELVQPGNLRQLLLNNSVPIDDSNKTKIANGIINAMAYLHSFKPAILHRDLKSSNVLVNKEFGSKVCDFGFSRIKANNRTMTKCGTIAYQAPEVLKGERYNEKADMYSFGVVLWEIETRQVPYQGKDVLAVQFDVIKGMRPDLKSISNQMKIELIQNCWHTNPEWRPHFCELEKKIDATALDIKRIHETE